jgi:NitT/TauT family transport system substrate-binding protein
MRSPASLLAIVLSVLVLLGAGGAMAAEIFKVGVLKFGTVNWLLDTVRHHRLDERNGFSLDVLPLASKNATSIAFLAGEADAIVTDWFWVLRQRAAGRDFVMVPYSAALGAVMVPPGSSIDSLGDLKGKRIGVAGGPLDKSWLLVRAKAQELGAGDLSETAEPVFGAPPLLNEQLIAGRIDAVVNFWPYAARLEGMGYRELVSMSALLEELDLRTTPPLIGFVFSGALATEKDETISGFVAALKQANEILRNSDAEWERLRPLMKAGSTAEFAALKARYRAGILTSWGDDDRHAAEQLFGILSKLGGEKLVGKGIRFDNAVFWRGFGF